MKEVFIDMVRPGFGRLVTEDGRTDAVGAICLAAGVSPSRLSGVDALEACDPADRARVEAFLDGALNDSDADCISFEHDMMISSARNGCAQAAADHAQNLLDSGRRHNVRYVIASRMDANPYRLVARSA